MKKIIVLLITIFISFVISCGVSTGEAVKAGQLPILQICPMEEVVPGEVPEVTNFFVEPVNVEEADNNIIVIETNVPEVKVSVNSTYMGISKITITDLLPGQYIVDLSKDGFENQRNFINVGKNRKTYFYFEMKQNN